MGLDQWIYFPAQFMVIETARQESRIPKPECGKNLKFWFVINLLPLISAWTPWGQIRIKIVWSRSRTRQLQELSLYFCISIFHLLVHSQPFSSQSGAKHSCIIRRRESYAMSCVCKSLFLCQRVTIECTFTLSRLHVEYISRKLSIRYHGTFHALIGARSPTIQRLFLVSYLGQCEKFRKTQFWAEKVVWAQVLHFTMQYPTLAAPDTCVQHVRLKLSHCERRKERCWLRGVCSRGAQRLARFMIFHILHFTVVDKKLPWCWYVSVLQFDVPEYAVTQVNPARAFVAFFALGFYFIFFCFFRSIKSLLFEHEIVKARNS